MSLCRIDDLNPNVLSPQLKTRILGKITEQCQWQCGMQARAAMSIAAVTERNRVEAEARAERARLTEIAARERDRADLEAAHAREVSALRAQAVLQQAVSYW